MRYRKMPIVIEAIQYHGDNHAEVDKWMQDRGSDPTEIPGWRQPMKIVTLEGVMLASPGDWIIQGVRGEFYPCKPDVFETTYELADDHAVLTRLEIPPGVL